MLCQWGELTCHAPLLLAWAVFKFVLLPHSDLEVGACPFFLYAAASASSPSQVTRQLGNRALQADVFGYLLSTLQSPLFRGESVSATSLGAAGWARPSLSSPLSPLQPIASVARVVIHTLLSLILSSFNEESLGDPAVSPHTSHLTLNTPD